MGATPSLCRQTPLQGSGQLLEVFRALEALLDCFALCRFSIDKGGAVLLSREMCYGTKGHHGILFWL